VLVIDVYTASADKSVAVEVAVELAAHSRESVSDHLVLFLVETGVLNDLLDCVCQGLKMFPSHSCVSWL
jgi:hypothetical protein